MPGSGPAYRRWSAVAAVSAMGAGLLLLGAVARSRSGAAPVGGVGVSAPARRVAEQLRQLEEGQREHRRLLEQLVAAEEAAVPTCMDSNDACESWKACCPGGDGQGANCGEADCSAPGKKPCEGGFTRESCQVTCGTCPAGTRHVTRPPAPTPAPPPGRAAELLALWQQDGNGLEGDLPGVPGVRWRALHADKPRVVYLTGVITPEEASSLINVSRPDLKRSMVVHPQNQSEGADPVRTSWGMWLSRPQQVNHPARVKLTRAMSAAIGVPERNFEAVQILRYEPGQYYVHHSDWFEDHMKGQLRDAGQRVASGIVFLNTVAPGGGGGTKFVYAKPEEVTVRPVCGDSVIFYDVDRRWRGDKYSEHEAVPPLPGHEKWVAITWMRENAFHM